MKRFADHSTSSRLAWLAATLVALLALGVISGAVLASSSSTQRDFDVRLGQRLYSLAAERGGAELRLSRSESRVMRRVFDDLASEARKQYNLPYSLHVLSSTAKVDAWSYPDGSVWVTMGLVRAVRQESEFAGIIAHQLAHAALRLGTRANSTPETQALLEQVANGKVAPTDRTLGKLLTSISGEYTTPAGEKDADDLAAILLRRARYDRNSLDRAWGRLVASDSKAPVLRAHPHPDVKPWTESETGTMVIVITNVAQPAPPVYPPSGGIAIVPTNPAPPPPPPSPVLPPTRLPESRNSAPHRERWGGFAVSAGFGAYPLPFTAKAVSMDYFDGTTNYDLDFNQGDKESNGVFRMDMETATKGGMALNFGGGVGITDALGANRDLGLFFLEGGVGKRLTLSESANLTVGAYLTGAWLTGRVLTIPGGPYDYMSVDNDAYHLYSGTPVYAGAGVIGAGLRAKASGSINSRLGWFASVQYQRTNKDEIKFTATDEWDGTVVTIPFTAATPDSAPSEFDATGLTYNMGLEFLF